VVQVWSGTMVHPLLPEIYHVRGTEFASDKLLEITLLKM